MPTGKRRALRFGIFLAMRLELWLACALAYYALASGQALILILVGVSWRRSRRRCKGWPPMWYCGGQVPPRLLPLLVLYSPPGSLQLCSRLLDMAIRRDGQSA